MQGGGEKIGAAMSTGGLPGALHLVKRMPGNPREQYPTVVLKETWVAT
jgi:hypothetical protein